MSHLPGESPLFESLQDPRLASVPVYSMQLSHSLNFSSSLSSPTMSSCQTSPPNSISEVPLLLDDCNCSTVLFNVYPELVYFPVSELETSADLELDESLFDNWLESPGFKLDS